MSPFTALNSECISSLAMTNFPSCYFTWGDIYLLVLPSLAASKIAFYSTIFGRSSLCPTLCFCRTPKSHAACTVHYSVTLYQNEPYQILFQSHQDPYPTTNNHKRPVSKPWIPSFPSTSSGPAPTGVLHLPQYVGTSSSPATSVTGRILQTLRLPLTSTFNLRTYLYILLKLSIVSHHIFYLLKG